MSNATKLLNLSVEQMTTGYKLNHAKDNAANYSISTNMSTKISAYEVAESNTSMGLDMLTTAADSLSQIEDKLSRLRALQEQATNGTYGEQSLKAINKEVNALVDEIERLYSTTSYNGINLFGELQAGFIQEITRRDTSGMTSLASVDETQALTSGTYSISTAEELEKLATMTNNGLISQGVEFVLANNIDISAYSSGEGWKPIGAYNQGDTSDFSKAFQGVFDGNGYVVSNLRINRADRSQGLFGVTYNASIKNLAIDSARATANHHSGVLIGSSNESDISNVTIYGDVYGGSGRGLLIGYMIGGSVDKCYAKGQVSTSSYSDNHDNGGGMIGAVATNASVSNSFCDVNIINGRHNTGGFVGSLDTGGIIENCYTVGSIDIVYDGNLNIGGFVGRAHTSGSNINNCYTLIEFVRKNPGQAGFAGNLGSGAKMEDCYVLSNSANVDSIMVFDLSYGTINNSFYNANYNTAIIPLVSTQIGSAVSNLQSYDSDLPYEYELKYFEQSPLKTSMQVGISSGDSSVISVETSLNLNAIKELTKIGLNTKNDYLLTIDLMLSTVTAKQTEYGAAQNRLMSALEEIAVQRDNLVSSCSTLRDADISEVSSQYIQQQILQQASATLLATANQSPSIALGLI